MDVSRFSASIAGRKEGSMSLKLLAIDLGKRSFHIHGIDSNGMIISRKTSRSELIETIKELAPQTLAMEAYASAHYWGRRFRAAGHRVPLINPRFVKPFVKGSKNDAADAEGIYEAAMRPTMRFVPVKSTEQPDLQSLHRARDRIVGSRTALINHMRGLLGEYGVILPQGAWRFLTQAHDAIAAAEISDLTRELFADMLDELRALDLRLDKLDRQLLALCRTNEACRRLSKLPGVGPVIATAIVAAVDDGRHFRSGRELAAWISLVPRQYSRCRQGFAEAQNCLPNSDFFVVAGHKNRDAGRRGPLARNPGCFRAGVHAANSVFGASCPRTALVGPYTSSL
jgi:transposase